MNGHLTILGPGVLGRSLSSWACLRGLPVCLAGRDASHAQAGLQTVLARWEQDVARGRLEAEAVAGARSRIRACASLEEALDGAGVLLEALPESLSVKASAWSKLEALASPGTLLLSGSSSLSVASLRQAAGLSRPLLGFHLFLPLERMDIVELVWSPDSIKDDLDRALHLGEALGKRVVRVKDGAGYAASRMAIVQGLEAMRLLESGAASAKDLDALMVHGYGHPVGPLELSDRIGLDLRLAIAEGIFRESGDPRYRPPRVLRRLVREGHLERKSGLGFHPWPDPEAAP